MRINNHEDTLRSLSPFVGILYAIWGNQKISYGTACAIAPQILITCTHNIYNIYGKEMFRKCEQIIFIPNPQEGQFNYNMQPYKAKDMYFFPLPEQQLTNPEPRTQELALIVLQRPLKIKKFIKLGKINFGQEQNEIVMISFPRFLSIQKSYQLYQAYIVKKFQIGKLCQSKPQQYIDKSYIACYTLSTFSGSSGSPGIMLKQNGEFKIVFIHTHKANDNKSYSLGLQFNTSVVLQLQYQLGQLQKKHNLENYDYFEPEINEFLEAYNQIFQESKCQNFDESNIFELDRRNENIQKQTQNQFKDQEQIKSQSQIQNFQSYLNLQQNVSKNNSFYEVNSASQDIQNYSENKSIFYSYKQLLRYCFPMYQQQDQYPSFLENQVVIVQNIRNIQIIALNTRAPNPNNVSITFKKKYSNSSQLGQRETTTMRKISS